jgi:hypothetical protein
MKNIVTPKILTDLSGERRKGSQIEKALEAVGSINLKSGKSPIKMGDMLKRHGRENFPKIKLD